MNKTENKNPLLTGLINVLIPGASQWYVHKDWKKFARTFVFAILALAAAIATGNAVQQTREYTLPQGLCMGVLIMIVAATLFAGGYKTARDRNHEADSATFYNAKRHVSHESAEVEHADIQKMRDEGLISASEYEEKNKKVKEENDPLE